MLENCFPKFFIKKKKPTIPTILTYPTIYFKTELYGNKLQTKNKGSPPIR